MTPTPFDLNIQEFLDAWTPVEALRELLSNALDEALLTETSAPEVRHDGTAWVIRDYGRGLQPKHLAQAESEEKTTTSLPVIGRFGVGLKDALATLHRRGVEVVIRSSHARYTLGLRGKSGREDVKTLHAFIDESQPLPGKGTEVRLLGLDDADLESAKALFLHFTPHEVLDRLDEGAILSKPEGAPGRVYVRGLCVAEEEEFLFSYDITKLTKAMGDALNRERSNVGRKAYSPRIQQLLRNSSARPVIEALTADVEARSQGRAHAEVRSWSDVAVHACRVLNTMEKVLFVDPEQQRRDVSAIEHAEGDGARVVVVPGDLLRRLEGENDADGQELRTLAVAVREWNESFQFDFVEPGELTAPEQTVWGRWRDIAEAVGGLPARVKDIRVSETMRPEVGHSFEVVGLWQSAEGRIVIKRSCLASLEAFAGTLAHEIAHARSRRGDVDRGFEWELTRQLGKAVARLLAAQTG